MKIAIYTLGCKVNQYETQALEGEALRRGHLLVPFHEAADAYLINTCTVTAVSDHKSRQAIRRAQKSAPNAVVAVCGCYGQTNPDAVAALGVHLVAGTADRMAFLDEVERLVQKRQQATGAALSSPEPQQGEALSPPSPRLVDDALSRRSFEFLPAGNLSGRTRSMLKVEDGCVNFCSYCIIPYARGPVRSLPLCRAVSEAKRLAGEGFRELVITGIEISSWGADFRDGTALIDLIEALSLAAPTLRLRLGSLEPRTITADFCRRAAALPNLCPHFHLSLQSGCDTVLQRMNRKYDTERYFRSVTLLRDAFRNPGITTDVIVGFPGETEEEFAVTLAFLEKCRFSALHIFPYSRRPGTPADSISCQCSNDVKNARAHRAGELARRLEEDFLQSLVGTIQTVLFETEQEGIFRGHCGNYAEIFVPGSQLHNETRPVRVADCAHGALQGSLQQEEEYF